MGWNPVNEAKKVFKKLKKEIEDAAKTAKKGIEDVGKKAKRGVEDTAKKGKNEIENAAKTAERGITDEIKKIGNEIEDGLKEAGEEIEKTFEERIPDLVEDIIDDMIEAVTKEGLSKTQKMLLTTHSELEKLRTNKPALVDEIDKLGGSFKIGPCKLSYSGYYSRLSTLTDVLGRYVKNPPSFNRTDIIAMILALGPDNVDVGIDVSFNALVVGSSAIEFGGSLDSIGINLATELLDVILEEIGVPEK